MEKKNYTIIDEVFVYKTKYIIHVVVVMTILSWTIVDGLETRKTGKLDKISTMRKVGFPNLESYNVDGK